MKLAIVHDFLNQYGGAEKVVEALHRIFPDAPIYTSIFIPENLPDVFRRMDIRTSFMQKLPGLNRHYKKYVPIYPRAIESFDLSGYDVILSSSSAFAKGARPAPGATHICYCYSPMRYVWDEAAYFAKEPVPFFLKPFLPPVLAALRRWDLKSLERVHRFVAISQHISARIYAAWGRPSSVIYPPVDTSQFRIAPEIGDYFLIVSRLTAYKRIDLAVEAFNRLGWPLHIAGAGPQLHELQRRAKSNIHFLGRISQEELIRQFSHCRGFIFPSKEDFGIAPVEAMASGRPVAAYAAGGALETVQEGVTGVFFREATPDALADAAARCKSGLWNPETIRAWASTFDTTVFESKIRSLIETVKSQK